LALLLKRIEAVVASRQIGRREQASKWEDFMSNLKYAIVENENVTNAVEQASKPQARPYLIAAGERNGVSIMRHAEQALDFELAQGSLPA
jgi:hypothetical protein